MSCCVFFGSIVKYDNMTFMTFAMLILWILP